jgi:hypothetical protein
MSEVISVCSLLERTSRKSVSREGATVDIGARWPQVLAATTLLRRQPVHAAAAVGNPPLGIGGLLEAEQLPCSDRLRNDFRYLH